MSHHHAAVANRSDKTAGQSRSEQPRIWRQCFKQQRAACRQNEKEVGDNAINRGRLSVYLNLNRAMESLLVVRDHSNCMEAIGVCCFPEGKQQTA